MTLTATSFIVESGKMAITLNSTNSNPNNIKNIITTSRYIANIQAPQGFCGVLLYIRQNDNSVLPHYEQLRRLKQP